MCPPSTPSAPEVRRYWWLALGVLALAALNLTFRLNKEFITEWDEGLYALSAWEMVTSRKWVATTLRGALDYYNTKPPLNLWLIAGSYEMFGPSLVSLRLVSVVSAWLTVATLQWWLWRAVGPAIAVGSSLVLTTCFGFLYTHSARSGNPDALFTFFILLTVITLWAGQRHPWRRVWLGPLLAGAFLLKGMGALLPLAIVVIFETVRLAADPKRRSLRPLVVAGLLTLAPVSLWIWARWQVDGWRFLERLITYDFFGSVFTALEEHSHPWWFYAGVLHRDHYAWLLAGAVACLLFPPTWNGMRAGLSSWSERNGFGLLLVTWAAVTFVIPTLMKTKLAWYLNPFYPVFAIGISWLVCRAAASARDPRQRWRVMVVAGTVAIAVVTTESRLFWYSLRYRDLQQSPQGLLLAERERMAGQQVFREQWRMGGLFVLRAIVRAEPRRVSSVDDFHRDSRPGDYLLWQAAVAHPNLTLARSAGGFWLYRVRP